MSSGEWNEIDSESSREICQNEASFSSPSNHLWNPEYRALFQTSPTSSA